MVFAWKMCPFLKQFTCVGRSERITSLLSVSRSRSVRYFRRSFSLARVIFSFSLYFLIFFFSLIRIITTFLLEISALIFFCNLLLLSFHSRNFFFFLAVLLTYLRIFVFVSSGGRIVDFQFLDWEEIGLILKLKDFELKNAT